MSRHLCLAIFLDEIIEIGNEERHPSRLTMSKHNFILNIFGHSG